MAPLDSSRVQAFVAVAREGGFSRAARALGRTQSSVSEAISQLEEELGHRLFSRDARRTVLTPEGQLLLEHAERILDEMATMRSKLAASGAEPEGELTVGTTDTLACYLLPPVFAALRKEHPKIQLRLDNRPSPSIAIEVAERRLPVGVVSLPLPPELRSGGRPISERLCIEPLVPLAEVVICAPSHPLAKRRSVTVEQLAEVPLLLLDRSTGSRALIDRAFEAIGRAPNVAMEARSVDVLKRLAELSFGVAVVPSMAVEGERRSGALAVLSLRGFAPSERTVGIVTHASGHLSPAARVFVELTRKRVTAETLPSRRRRLFSG